MASKLHYYSALDTVYFSKDVSPELYAARAVSATGVVMLDMLIGGATPLLSQTQAFDNALLLAQLAQPSPACRALLRLVRNNRIQVRILDTPALRQRPEHSERFTLLNAFCSALAQPGFVLSAWPELADQRLRAQVLDILDHNPDSVTELDDKRLTSRLEGLIELDVSLRQSSSIERTPPAPGSGLASRVYAGLAALTLHDQRTAGFAKFLLEIAHAAPSEQMNRRSAWYTLLDEHIDSDSLAMMNVRGIIDGAYNSVVADSLGATGAFTLCPTDEVAQALAATQENTSRAGQLSALAQDPRRYAWLSWEKLAELLPDFDHMANPQRRLGYILSEHQSFVGRTEVDKRGGLALKAALPHAIVSIMVGIAAGGLGDSIGGGFGAATGAGVAGILSLFAAHPVVGRWQAKWGEKTRGKAAAQWEATVTSGTASIRGMIQR